MSSGSRVKIESGGTWSDPKGEGYLKSYSPQRLDPADPEGFRNKVVGFFKANAGVMEKLVTGNVQLLGLTEIKESFGDRWPVVRDKVQLVAESCVKAHITTNDLYILAGDDNFMILFGRDSKAEADAKAAAIAKDIGEKLNGVEVAGAVTVKAVTMEAPAPKSPDEIADPEKLKAEMEAAQEAQEQKELDAFEEILPDLQVKYWPVTNIDKRIVSLYEAFVDGGEAAMAELMRARSEEVSTGAVIRELDCFTLAQAGQMVFETGGPGEKALVVVPVHYETLSVKGFRDHFVQALKLLSPQTKSRLLCMVMDTPPNVPQSRLHQLFTVIAPFFRGFICRFPMTLQNADNLGGLRLLGLAADGEGHEKPTAELVAEMKAFSQLSRKSKLKSYFTGGDTMEMATAARRCHFTYLRGAAAIPAMPRAGRVLMVK